MWYDWKNDGPDPKEREHNFGTVTLDLKAKPAYVAIQTLTRELSGCRVERRIPLSNDQDYMVLCAQNPARGQKLAAWTLGGPHSVSLEVTLKDSNKLSAVNGTGESFRPKVESGRLLLDLTSAPQYVTLGEVVFR